MATQTTQTALQKIDIEIFISNENPLSNQVKKITGDPYNSHDFEDLPYNNGKIIKHIETGLIFRCFGESELQVMKEKKAEFTPPYVNLNGNSKDDLQNQILKIYKSFTPVIQAIAETEYHNGRNSTDDAHYKKMRADKTTALQEVREMQEKFLKLFKGI